MNIILALLIVLSPYFGTMDKEPDFVLNPHRLIVQTIYVHPKGNEFPFTSVPVWVDTIDQKWQPITSQFAKTDQFGYATFYTPARSTIMVTIWVPSTCYSVTSSEPPFRDDGSGLLLVARFTGICDRWEKLDAGHFMRLPY